MTLNPELSLANRLRELDESLSTTLIRLVVHLVVVDKGDVYSADLCSIQNHCRMLSEYRSASDCASSPFFRAFDGLIPARICHSLSTTLLTLPLLPLQYRTPQEACMKFPCQQFRCFSLMKTPAQMEKHAPKHFDDSSWELCLGDDTLATCGR